MAGSLNHVTTDGGKFLAEGRTTITRKPGNKWVAPYGVKKQAFGFQDMIENMGDAYEAIEEMWGIIAVLAGGSAERVEQAKREYERGLRKGLDRGLTRGTEEEPDA